MEKLYTSRRFYYYLFYFIFQQMHVSENRPPPCSSLRWCCKVHFIDRVLLAGKVMRDSVKLVDCSWKQNFNLSLHCCCQFSSDSLWVLLAHLEGFYSNHKAESAAQRSSTIQRSLSQAWDPLMLESSLGQSALTLPVVHYLLHLCTLKRGCGVKCALQRAQEVNYLTLVNFYSLRNTDSLLWFAL